MDWNLIKRNLAQAIYPTIFNERDKLEIKKKAYTKKILELTEKVQSSDKAKIKLVNSFNLKLTDNTKTIKELNEQLVLKYNSKIDICLKDKFSVIDPIAYTGKRKYKGHDVRMWLHQLITPEQYEVQRFKKKYGIDKDNMVRVQELGNRLAILYTWKSDKDTNDMIDHYAYAEEFLVSKEDDCETHAFTLASMEPCILGVVYGYFTQNNKRFGHAWNCLVYDNELYHVETTGNTCNIYPWTETKYEPHFIVTKKNTYQVAREMTVFGKLAPKIN